jgi:hypothetical protein
MVARTVTLGAPADNLRIHSLNLIACGSDC